MYTLNSAKDRLCVNNYNIDLNSIDFIAMEKCAAYQGQYCVVFHIKAGKTKTMFKESASKNGRQTYDNYQQLADLLIGEGTPFAEISGVRLINAANITGYKLVPDEKRGCQNVIIDFGVRNFEFINVRENDISLIKNAVENKTENEIN